MNKKLSLLAILCIGTIVSISVNAEDLSNCKKILNGVCIEKDTTNTKPIYNIKSSNVISNADNSYNQPKLECKYRYGWDYIFDPYYTFNKKAFIIDIEPNGSAQKAGLKVGDEIIKLNNIKISRMSGNDFNNNISAQHISLEIKNNSGEKIISMSKDNMCTPTKDEDLLFNSYWNQIYTGMDLDYVNRTIINNSRIWNKLSYGTQRDLQEYKDHYSYWQPKKIKFKNGYNVCKAHSTDYEIRSCLSDLVNRELAQIQHEENIRQQQAALQAQQQMQQQQINAMNNYANALRNQHVNVNSNVQHSGTVNVNQNVYGTMYHYNRW